MTADTSGLESADEWVKAWEKLHPTDVRRLDTAQLTLNPATLKGPHPRVFYFGNNFEKK